MRKPEKSIKKRMATLKRGEKRAARFKKTQANKAERTKKRQSLVEAQKKKFKAYLDSLMGK